MFEREKHHVIAARRKSNGFARLDFQAALHGAHFHHPALHRHAVDLALRAGVIGDAAHFVGRGALIGERHVAGPRTLWRGPRPWSRDMYRAHAYSPSA